jgi:AcrR family transcriptional regulator
METGWRRRRGHERDSKNLAFSLVKQIDQMGSAMFDCRVTANVDVCRLTVGQLERLQRAHIALALVDAVVQGGHDDPAVADILARAGVSRKTFYRLFEGKDDARREAAELLWRRALDQVTRAGAAYADPVARAHACALALSRLVASHPRHARLVVADSVVTGLPGLLAVLDPAAGEPSGAASSPSGGQTPQRNCGGVPQNSDAGDRAVEAAILGADGGPAALLARAGHRPHADGLGVQSHRALAVLLAQPGASGAQVQRALGHLHASQTSRLLHRLRRQGLATVARGSQRSRWSLTRAGLATARKGNT